MTAPENILNIVENYVRNFLDENLAPSLTFHNVNHTHEVVHAINEIGSQFQLAGDQLQVVLIAGWFHDCGYTKIYAGHEDVSKKIARRFLEDNEYPAKLIENVLTCIEGTRYPQSPETLGAKILCDADLYHFTKPDYHCYEHALRMEHQYYFKTTYSDDEWVNVNCEMLRAHQYFTDYGTHVLQKFKEVNIERMKCKKVEL